MPCNQSLSQALALQKENKVRAHAVRLQFARVPRSIHSQGTCLPVPWKSSDWNKEGENVSPRLRLGAGRRAAGGVWTFSWGFLSVWLSFISAHPPQRKQAPRDRRTGSGGVTAPWWPEPPSRAAAGWGKGREGRVRTGGLSRSPGALPPMRNKLIKETAGPPCPIQAVTVTSVKPLPRPGLGFPICEVGICPCLNWVDKSEHWK